MSNVPGDIQYAWRALRAQPLFLVVAVLSLGLGIGANTAIFSMIESSLLRGLPFRQADRLIYIRDHQPCCETASVSPGEYLDYKAQSKTLDGLAAASWQSLTMTGSGEPQKLRGQAVTTNFFEVLGAHAQIGRLISSAIDKPGDTRVAVISEGLWRTRFGADPTVLGYDITLNGNSFKIVGVLPAKQQYPHDVDVWVSPRRLVPEYLEGEIAKDDDITKQYGNHWMVGIGRLKPGVSLSEARAELKTISARIAAVQPSNKDHWAVLFPLQDTLVREIRPALWVLLAAVVVLLLIACANLAGLLLARATARSREMAVRISLGATRSGIVRLFLAESLLLAVLGGVLGIALAAGALRLIQHYSPYDLPPALAPELNLPVLAFCFAVTLVTALISGVAPALQAARVDINQGLKEASKGSAGQGTQRLRRLLVAGEIALSVMLLIGSALLIRSFSNLISVDPGFDPKNVTSAVVTLPETRYNHDQVTAFWDRLVPRIESLPGVESAGLITDLPMNGNDSGSYVELENRPLGPNETGPYANEFGISAGTLRAMRVSLLKGRGFDERDRPGALKVMLINEAFATKYYPNQDPIGRHIKGGPVDGWVTIVGVVGDIKHNGLDDKPELDMLFPYSQLGWSGSGLVLRARPGMTISAQDIRRAVRELDPNLAVTRIQPLEEYIGKSLVQRRFLLGLLMAFSALAMLLAVIGIYGVIAYSVEQRKRELGVRLALGSSQSRVVRLVLRDCMAMAALGVLAGIVGTAWSASLLKTLLFNVSSGDVAAYSAAIGVILLATLVAGLIPAWRASRIDPVAALRSE